MPYCQRNSIFHGQQSNYNIHYLTGQNRGLSGLKNIWPVIMTGDLLSVILSLELKVIKLVTFSRSPSIPRKHFLILLIIKALFFPIPLFRTLFTSVSQV